MDPYPHHLFLELGSDASKFRPPKRVGDAYRISIIMLNKFRGRVCDAYFKNCAFLVVES